MKPLTIFRELSISDISVLNRDFPAPKRISHQDRITTQSQLSHTMYGLFIDSKLIGICQIHWLGPIDTVAASLATCPEISSLYVLEAYRGRGYGKQIIKMIETELINQEYEMVGLVAHTENEAGLKLYKQLGYQIIGPVDDSGGGIPNRLYLEKSLSK